MIPAYARRITAEERLLESELGDAYAGYRRRTRRLLPGIS
jgi:protein-S-isoprenylcysteine O-methyltransferase Ste14